GCSSCSPPGTWTVCSRSWTGTWASGCTPSVMSWVPTPRTSTSSVPRVTTAFPRTESDERPTMSTILEIENLTVGFGDAAPVLDDVSLEVADGEVLALVGESGSGKSMTALSANRLLPRGAAMRAGTITVDG